MTRRFVDISNALESDIASDPPIIQPYFWRRLGLAAAAAGALLAVLARRLLR